MYNDECVLCPRKCGANRNSGVGFCGADNKIQLARAALHFWEEPCISGKSGSGAVFFCGCSLKCVYCQNFEISRGYIKKSVSEKELAEIFLRLQSEGAHNINLVTPTHFILQIKNSLDLVKDRLCIPVVYNCGGYESKTGLSYLDGYIDVYLTDFKYADNFFAEKYSGASDYFETALSALREMISQLGTPVYNEDGMLKRGVIVRHLVLPSLRKDSFKILDALKNEFGTDSFILSLMSQYTPNGHLLNYPELNRRVTSFEYNSVVNYALDLGFSSAYTQKRESATPEFTPPFDFTGV